MKKIVASFLMGVFFSQHVGITELRAHTYETSLCETQEKTQTLFLLAVKALEAQKKGVHNETFFKNVVHALLRELYRLKGISFQTADGKVLLNKHGTEVLGRALTGSIQLNTDSLDKLLSFLMQSFASSKQQEKSFLTAIPTSVKVWSAAFATMTVIQFLAQCYTWLCGDRRSQTINRPEFESLIKRHFEEPLLERKDVKNAVVGQEQEGSATGVPKTSSDVTPAVGKFSNGMESAVNGKKKEDSVAEVQNPSGRQSPGGVRLFKRKSRNDSKGKKKEKSTSCTVENGSDSESEGFKNMPLPRNPSSQALPIREKSHKNGQLLGGLGAFGEAPSLSQLRKFPNNASSHSLSEQPTKNFTACFHDAQVHQSKAEKSEPTYGLPLSDSEGAEQTAASAYETACPSPRRVGQSSSKNVGDQHTDQKHHESTTAKETEEPPSTPPLGHEISAAQSQPVHGQEQPSTDSLQGTVASVGSRVSESNDGSQAPEPQQQPEPTFQSNVLGQHADHKHNEHTTAEEPEKSSSTPPLTTKVPAAQPQPLHDQQQAPTDFLQGTVRSAGSSVPEQHDESQVPEPQQHPSPAMQVSTVAPSVTQSSGGVLPPPFPPLPPSYPPFPPPPPPLTSESSNNSLPVVATSSAAQPSKVPTKQASQDKLPCPAPVLTPGASNNSFPVTATPSAAQPPKAPTKEVSQPRLQSGECSASFLERVDCKVQNNTGKGFTHQDDNLPQGDGSEDSPDDWDGLPPSGGSFSTFPLPLKDEQLEKVGKTNKAIIARDARKNKNTENNPK